MLTLDLGVAKRIEIVTHFLSILHIKKSHAVKFKMNATKCLQLMIKKLRSTFNCE